MRLAPTEVDIKNGNVSVFVGVDVDEHTAGVIESYILYMLRCNYVGQKQYSCSQASIASFVSLRIPFIKLLAKLQVLV